jgi:uncharacterized protein YqhQ
MNRYLLLLTVAKVLNICDLLFYLDNTCKDEGIFTLAVLDSFLTQNFESPELANQLFLSFTEAPSVLAVLSFTFAYAVTIRNDDWRSVGFRGADHRGIDCWLGGMPVVLAII